MLGKNPQSHKGIRDEVSVYEQKSVKIRLRKKKLKSVLKKEK